MRPVAVSKISRGMHCTDVILTNNRVICSARPDWTQDPNLPSLRVSRWENVWGEVTSDGDQRGFVIGTVVDKQAYFCTQSIEETDLIEYPDMYTMLLDRMVQFLDEYIDEKEKA